MSHRNRHFLKLLDFDPVELEHLIQAVLTLKRLTRCGQEQRVLQNRNLALLLESSMREVRWTVQAGVAAQGGTAHYFGPGETGLGAHDPASINARQLGRLYQALLVAGLPQERVEETARSAGVPVVNLGSNEFQPLTALADLATLAEHSTKPLADLSLVLLGDGTTSVAQSLLVAASKLGIDLRVCGPESKSPETTLLETCQALASETGAQIRLYNEPEQAMKGADFVYAQSWTGDLDERSEDHLEELLPYRASSDLMAHSGERTVRLLHRLPISLGDETDQAVRLSERFGVDGLEVSRELFESASNLCFEQVENSMHAVKAVLITLF